jgi:hypothetical protein
MSTFTTGEARQRDLLLIRHLVAVTDPTVAGYRGPIPEVDHVNLVHDTAGRENPILVLLRRHMDERDPYLATTAARFLRALTGVRVAAPGWDLVDDIYWALEDARNFLRHDGRQDADDVIASYRQHATAVLTRLASAA